MITKKFNLASKTHIVVASIDASSRFRVSPADQHPPPPSANAAPRADRRRGMLLF
jgi:hypothetical protein